MKTTFAFAALVTGASAFTSSVAFRPATALSNGPVKGSGGMFDTRDPGAFKHEDPRKSIGEAPSFEEYLKQRDGAAAAPAAAPVAPAPVPVAAAPVAPPAYVAPPAPVAPAAPAGDAHSAKGAGGMFDTRDPAAFKHEDPRKSIAEAPSFEEYLKSRKD